MKCRGKNSNMSSHRISDRKLVALAELSADLLSGPYVVAGPIGRER
jgi:hypothetical protein